MLVRARFTAYTLGLDGSEFTAEELEFMSAIAHYQKLFGRRYPTWREVLHVARCLGYRKVAAPAAIAIPSETDSASPRPGDTPCCSLVS